MDTRFPNLAVKIVRWQSLLEQSSLPYDDQEELRSHLDDIIQELCMFDLSEDEIWEVTMKRIGPLSILEQEFDKVNPDVGFRKKVLVLVYGGVLMLFLQLFFILLPVYIYKEYKNVAGSSSGIPIWPIFFISFTFLLCALSLLFLFRGKSIIKHIIERIQKKTILPAFISIAVIIASAFFVIQLLDVRRLDSNDSAAPAFKILSQVYYLSQIAVVGYFLLVNRSIRSFLSFNRNINWKTSLLLGSFGGLAITFCFTYHISSLPLLIGCPLFAILGWMVSFSKKPLLNLFFCQAYVMVLWSSEFSGRFFGIFTTIYIVILFFLLLGSISQKVYDLIVVKIRGII